MTQQEERPESGGSV